MIFIVIQCLLFTVTLYNFLLAAVLLCYKYVYITLIIGCVCEAATHTTCFLFVSFIEGCPSGG